MFIKYYFVSPFNLKIPRIADNLDFFFWGWGWDWCWGFLCPRRTVFSSGYWLLFWWVEGCSYSFWDVVFLLFFRYNNKHNTRIFQGWFLPFHFLSFRVLFLALFWVAFMGSFIGIVRCLEGLETCPLIVLVFPPFW